MRNFIYRLLKFWVKTSLHLYYRQIIVNGLENVPLEKPVLFLPNHQNALLDPLLIAVDCNRKPFFLTRSDVFKNNVFNNFFKLIRMIPIYRIRDGRDSLKHNAAVFEKCAKLLAENESLLMFPEANHNLKRQVRPLSKGFTRILFKALELQPDLDIQLIPVGFNYLYGEDFPDRVSIFFGEGFTLKDLINHKDQRTSVENIKQKVSEALQKLTTHIPEEDYSDTLKKLDAQGVNFLDPVATNKVLRKNEGTPELKKSKWGRSPFRKVLLPFFCILNLPVVLLWKLWLKPKVWEPEFTATLRFALSLVAFPIYYLVLFGVLFFTFDLNTAALSTVCLFVFNWLYVKIG